MSILLLGLVSFVAWFFSMLAGGGSPLVLIPLVNTLLGAEAVAPVITVGMLVGNGQRSLFFWDKVDWKVTAWYLPGAIIGAILGAYVLTTMQLNWLQWVIGGALLAMGINHWVGKLDWQFETKAWYFLPVSFFNAIGSALIGSTGPIMNPLYLGYGLVKEEMIATKAVHKTVLHIVKIMAYVALGTIHGSDLFYGLVIGAAAIPANLLGKQVLKRMSVEQFKNWVFGFVIVSGLLMVIQQQAL